MSTFSKSYESRISEIRSDVGIVSSFDETDDSNRPMFGALWDTGANMSAISSHVAQTLNLAPISYVSMETANGRCEVPLYIIDLMLPGGNSVKRVKVIGINMDVCDALIGMDVITMGDFLLTNAPNTKFEFRIPSIGAPPLA